MRLNSQTRDRLAAEYVLGTLEGKARVRFEAMMKSDVELRDRVDRWSNSLDLMGQNIAPIQPPSHLWQALTIRLNLKSEKPILTDSLSNWWQSLALWRSTSIVATITALIMALYIGFLPKQVELPAQSYVAVLNNQNAQSAWIIKAQLPQGQLSIQTLTPQQIAAENSFELWLLPANNQAPRSLGLVANQGKTQLTLSTDLAAALPAAQGLAISLEPAGGSTTDLPTGPILYQGKIQFL